VDKALRKRETLLGTEEILAYLGVPPDEGRPSDAKALEFLLGLRNRARCNERTYFCTTAPVPWCFQGTTCRYGEKIYVPKAKGTGIAMPKEFGIAGDECSCQGLPGLGCEEGCFHRCSSTTSTRPLQHGLASRLEPLNQCPYRVNRKGSTCHPVGPFPLALQFLSRLDVVEGLEMRGIVPPLARGELRHSGHLGEGCA